MLDTNIISELIKPVPNKNVIKKVLENKNFCAISAISWQEMLTGVKLLPAGKRKQMLLDFYYSYVNETFTIVDYKSSDAIVYADFVSECKKKGFPLPYYDAQIAANAKNNEMILVTRNADDFLPIANFCNLPIENWFDEI